MSTTISFHPGHGEKPPKARVNVYPDAAPLGAVDLDGGAISVVAKDPVDLFHIADAFAKAAHELRAALVEHAACGDAA